MTLPKRLGYSASDETKNGGGSGSTISSHHNIGMDSMKPFAPSDQQVSPFSNPPYPYLTASPDKGSHDLNKYGTTSLQLHDMMPHGSLMHPSHMMHAPDTRADPYKTFSIDSLTQDQIQARKNFVRNHHLLHTVMAVVEECKKESVVPPIPPTVFQPSTASDFSLNEFLEAQGIETPEEDEVDPQTDEFGYKLQQLRSAYSEELEKLNRVCTEFVQRTAALLREQSQVRAVTDQEMQCKTGVIQQRFDYVRNQLRTNVCNAILVLQKQYHHQTKKRRRSLSKRATEILSHWFFDHINDPYPSDEEKSMLAAQCVLSLNQVNNWFGNKRIRYKRKCLEEEARRAKLVAQGQGSGLPMPINPKLLMEGDEGDLDDDLPPLPSPHMGKRRHDDSM
eukprot:TRINITY_DN1030_c0_g1_i1.p1 TRINITY_DN1030_c0_g1~~TRINITY_DN1030_c0_g1_i1.p1  ORF type:complete len:392 (+),score=111.66 TRINITY_DN1030_c0_g1_i1:140-1315(+)